MPPVEVAGADFLAEVGEEDFTAEVGEVEVIMGEGEEVVEATMEVEEAEAEHTMVAADPPWEGTDQVEGA